MKAQATLEVDEREEVEEMAGKRRYETRENVGALRRYVRRSLSWSAARQPAAILATLFVWHLLTTFDLPGFKQVSSPLEVAREAIEVVPTRLFALHVLWSNLRVVVGFMAALAVGVPLGLGMGYKKVFQDLTFPVFEVLRPIPPIAWLPLSVIVFPTPETSVIYLVFIGAFFPIVLNTMLGVVMIEENFKRAALSLGASPREVFRRIILPGAMPAIFTGMQVGMGMTWIMVVAAEMVAGGYGLGYMTWEAFTFLRYARIILGMISIGICGFVLSAIVRAIGKRAMPWRQLF